MEINLETYDTQQQKVDVQQMHYMQTMAALKQISSITRPTIDEV